MSESRKEETEKEIFLRFQQIGKAIKHNRVADAKLNEALSYLKASDNRPGNQETAEVLLQKIAEENPDYLPAKSYLGFLYANNDNEEIRKRGIALLEEAIEDSSALYHLGILTEIGIYQSEKNELEFYVESAVRGFRDAQTALGFAYLEGERVEIDQNEALHWFTKAADQGDKVAQEEVEKLILQQKKEKETAAEKLILQEKKEQEVAAEKLILQEKKEQEAAAEKLILQQKKEQKAAAEQKLSQLKKNYETASQTFRETHLNWLSFLILVILSLFGFKSANNRIEKLYAAGQNLKDKKEAYHKAKNDYKELVQNESKSSLSQSPRLATMLVERKAAQIQPQTTPAVATQYPVSASIPPAQDASVNIDDLLRAFKIEYDKMSKTYSSHFKKNSGLDTKGILPSEGKINVILNSLLKNVSSEVSLFFIKRLKTELGSHPNDFNNYLIRQVDVYENSLSVSSSSRFSFRV